MPGRNHGTSPRYARSRGSDKIMDAIITCTCPSIRIPDLGLTLSKGNVVHLDAETAKASRDLATAVKAFGVKIEYVGRCRSQRPGGARNVSHAVSKPVFAAPPELPRESGIDLDVLAGKVAERMGKNVGTIRKLLKDDLRELLLETLAGLSLGMSQSENSGRVGEKKDAVPMFIPDGLVGDTEVEIGVQIGSFEGDSVDEADAALRHMRKKK